VIHKLNNSIWNKEKLPDQWKESIIVPLHKTGDKTDCNNYCGISLLSTSYKMLSTLTDASKEAGLEVNVKKTKYMLVPRDQSADQNRVIKIGNKSFENVSQFKYFGTTVINQNLIQEDIKRRLNSGNACYLSVQNLLSSLLMSRCSGCNVMGMKHGL
jgi:hypothetical protein